MKVLLSIILLVLCLNVNAADVIVWAEDSNSVTLDRYTLQKIFTRKVTKWPNGQPIQVFIKPMYSVEHRDFVLTVLGMSLFTYLNMLDNNDEEYRYQRISNPGKQQRQFIIEVSSDKQMLQKIEQLPGSIGYVNYKVFIGSKEVIIINETEIK